MTVKFTSRSRAPIFACKQTAAIHVKRLMMVSETRKATISEVKGKEFFFNQIYVHNEFGSKINFF